MVVGTCNIDEFAEPDESVMLVGARLTLKPAGELELLKTIVPAKPPTLARSIADVAVPPCVRVMDDGLADMAKSVAIVVKVTTTV